jgi:stage IV sporulation protein FB
MRLDRVEATGSFFLVLAWLNYLDEQGIVPLAMLACALHEGCHYFAIRSFGRNVRLIRLTAVGAEMVITHPLGYLQEGVAALAGPGGNLLLALIFCQVPGGAVFSGVNLALGCFNLMPIGRLDGGRAVRCTLSLFATPRLVENVCFCLDAVFTAVVLVCGLLLVKAGGNLSLLLVSLWLLAGVFSRKKGGNKSACHAGRKRVK